MKKVIISAVTALVLVAPEASASLKSFADGVVSVQDGAGTYSTQDRTILYGGGYTMRVPNITLTPFNVKAPSLRAGCGGIDMVFGSLGFLNADYFVKFAEGIMAAAPGVAFDLALKTLCPSCSETLKALEAMANQINSTSMDSCQAAKALANTALEAVSGNNATEKLGDNKVNDFFSTINKEYIKPATEWVAEKQNDLSSLLGGSIAKPKIVQFILQSDNTSSTRSLAEYLTGSMSYFDDIDINVIRSVTGDITIESFAKDKLPTILVERPSLNAAIDENRGYLQWDPNTFPSNTEKILNRLIGEQDSIPHVYNSENKITQSAFAKGQLFEAYFNKTKGIINKVINRTALSKEELEFLGYFKFPVYKIFNTLGNNEFTQPLLDSSSANLAKMLSAQILYEYFSALGMQIQVQQAALDSYSDFLASVPYSPKELALNKAVERMTYNTKIASGVAYGLYQKAYSDFISNLNANESIKKAREMKNLVLIRTNPDLLNNLLFLETISKK